MALNQIGEIASGVVEYDFDYITGTGRKERYAHHYLGLLERNVGPA